MQVAADHGGILAGRLEVDDEPVLGVLAAERCDVAVRRAGEVGQGLDAPADQPPGHVQGVRAVQGPPPLADPLPVPRLRVVLERHPAGDEARVPLHVRAGPADKVEPAQEPVGNVVRGVGEVVPVQRGPPQPGGDRKQDRGQVGEAHEPRRLRCGERVPVQQVDEVDRGLAAPRREDAADRGVAQHRGELGGTGGGRTGGDAGAVHLVPDHHVEPCLAQPADAEVDAGGRRPGDTGRGRRDTDAVAVPEGCGNLSMGVIVPAGPRRLVRFYAARISHRASASEIGRPAAVSYQE